MNKIILKIKAGSYLYGTNTPSSDRDYLGVYLNTKEELLGLQTSEELTQNIESKADNGRNTKDAVDCKFYELRKFCSLALKCNPTILEILFVNRENILEITPEGEELLKLKKEFLSRHLCNSFMGYAIAQEKKAFIKSENIKQIEGLYNYLKQYITTINQYFSLSQYLAMSFDVFYQRHDFVESKQLDSFVNFFQNTANDNMFQCGDLVFPESILIKKLMDSLKLRLDKASWRKDGMLQYGLDYKFLSHNVRLMMEGIEILKTKDLILPLQYRELIKYIKEGKMENNEIIRYMQSLKENFRELEKNNDLPDKGNFKKINQFVVDTYYNYLMSLK